MEKKKTLKFSKQKYFSIIMSFLILSVILVSNLGLVSLISTKISIKSEFSNENLPITTEHHFDTPRLNNITILSSDSDSFNQATTLYDEAESFFNDSKVHVINLYFENEDWYEELYNGHANDPDDPYFPARFVYNDIELDPIGINFKGHSSFTVKSCKKSFRIDFNYFNKEMEFFGLKKLNLNNGFKDPTMLREKIFWDIASNYVSVVRCVFIQVNVNDEYYGIYTAIEHIDDEFVESRYGSKEKGNLYRAESQGTLSYLGESTNLYSNNYELKTNEKINDYSGLIELTNVLTNTPTEELQEEIEKILDVKDTLYCLALLNIFSSLDSYIGSAHNYYLYQSDLTGQFKHILWDSNEAFGRFIFGLDEGQDVRFIDPYWTPTSMVRPPPEGPPGGGFPPRTSTDRPLFERLLEIESYNRTYLRILADMIRYGFNIKSMSNRIQELADLIREDVYADPNKPFTNQEFELALTDGFENIYGLENFIELRSDYLNETLNSYAKKTDIQINEIMIQNDGVISDETSEFQPWIEIYNLGPGRVNLENLYLTNNSDIPNKWAFSDLYLDDGEFYLIWADEEPSEGDNHLSFTLQDNGGEIFLFLESDSGSYSLLDEVTYPALIFNSSYGKFPDGNGEWQEMNDFPSPNEQNEENSIIVKLPTTLHINEIMAENKYTIEDPDDARDFPDWIELYNSGNESIDLFEMYLTDFLSDPIMWQFPEETIIDAYDYLIIWADNEPDQGDFHTNFKLSGEGEEIGLISNDGCTIIDCIVFSSAIQDYSIGRIPDGSDNLDLLISTPTPGTMNSNLVPEETSSIQTGIFYVFLGGLIGLSIIINFFHRKMQHKNNGQFWETLPTSMTRKKDINTSIKDVAGGN